MWIFTANLITYWPQDIRNSYWSKIISKWKWLKAQNKKHGEFGFGMIIPFFISEYNFSKTTIYQEQRRVNEKYCELVVENCCLDVIVWINKIFKHAMRNWRHCTLLSPSARDPKIQVNKKLNQNKCILISTFKNLSLFYLICVLRRGNRCPRFPDILTAANS